MTTKEASERWGISERRVRVLCSERKIAGAVQEGRGWKIPVDSQKPADGRFKSKESIIEQIDRKKKELDGRRPLTEGELERLREEFAVEYTYNSNAIEGNRKRNATNRKHKVSTPPLRKTSPLSPALAVSHKPTATSTRP